MKEPIEEVEAVRRRVAQDPETRTVVVSRAYETSIEDLWDACTNPARIPRWFLPVSGQLRLGGRYQLQGNAGGTIERCDPPRSFAATWEYGDAITWIELHLSPESDGRTRLELAHIAPDDPERWAEYGPGAVGVGWDLALSGLATHLHSGDTVDPAAAAAWSASEEGKRFITASSQGWCEASVASGTDPAGAQAAAERTTAFYCPVASAKPTRP